MANQAFITFRKFNDPMAAQELGELIAENNIEYVYEDASASFDPGFTNNELAKEYRIKLRKQDFEAADKVLLQVSAAALDELEPDYYLYDFSNDELEEIIRNRDEWSDLDFVLAQKLLKERGKEILPEEVKALEDKRIQTLAAPEKSQSTYITLGYIMAVLGGVVGLFIGWHLHTHKKTLPNGDMVHAYSETDRTHGRRIMIVGFFGVLALIIRTLFG